MKKQIDSARTPVMKAMILAAGLGTRLRPLTDRIPKPLVPVANEPNLLRIIRHLKRAGIVEYFINLHHRAEAIRAAIGDGSALGVTIRWFEEPVILGTGGGIRQMLPHMDGTFLVANADALFFPDIAALVDAHRRSGALATMVVHAHPDPETIGAVGVDDAGVVRRLVNEGDRSLARLFMFTGMHILEKKMHEHLPEEGCIVRKTYMPLVAAGHDGLRAKESTAPFRDLGTPRDYLDANLDVLAGAFPLPGFTPPPDGNLIAPDVQMGRDTRIEQCVIGSGARIAEGIRLRRCVVLPDAVVHTDLDNTIVCGDGTCMPVSRC